MHTGDRKTAVAAPALSIAAISALHRGKKIEAIKILREERKIALKEAKDAVEEYVESRSALRSSLRVAQAQTHRTILLWAVALVGLALLAYHFLVRT